MSVHSLPDAAALADLQANIRQRPDVIFAREDGVWQAAIFLQTLEDHGPGLTAEQAGEIYRDMVLDEIARLPKPDDSALADASLLAVARFAGFFEALGGFLFDAWKARYGQQ